MKVFICLQHFLPGFVAGTEIYTLRLAQYLQQIGAVPTILIPHFGHSFTDQYEFENVRVLRYAENSIEDREMIMGKRKPEGLEEFINILKEEQPDVIHFHDLTPGWGVNIFHVEEAHALNIPVVITFHLSLYSCFKGSLIYKDAEKCDGVIRVKRCTECVYHSKGITGVKAKVLSNAAYGLFKLSINATRLNNKSGTALGFPFVISKIKTDLLRLSQISKKLIVIAEWYRSVLEINAVPAAKIIYIQQGLANEVTHPLLHAATGFPLKIVFIGRISPLKGLHLLIDAVCRLPEEKVSLHIYGQEIEKDYTIECKQKSSFKKNIHWMGTVAAKDVIATLSGYHLLCLPSVFSEMSPLVIREAFAARIPVLASDVYGNAEQINDGINGWLFRFNDPDDLTTKLNYLCDDMNLIEQAKLRLPAAVSFKDIAARHLKLYSEISS